MAVHDGMFLMTLSSFTPCSSLSLAFTASLLSSVLLLPPDGHSHPLSILPHSLPAYIFIAVAKCPLSILEGSLLPLCMCVCTLMSGLSFR